MGKELSEEMTQFKFDIHGHVTRCFSNLMKGQVKMAQQGLDTLISQDSASEPLVIMAQVIINYYHGKLSACL